MTRPNVPLDHRTVRLGRAGMTVGIMRRWRVCVHAYYKHHIRDFHFGPILKEGKHG